MNVVAVLMSWDMTDLLRGVGATPARKLYGNDSEKATTQILKPDQASAPALG